MNTNNSQGGHCHKRKGNLIKWFASFMAIGLLLGTCQIANALVANTLACGDSLFIKDSIRDDTGTITLAGGKTFDIDAIHIWNEDDNAYYSANVYCTIGNDSLGVTQITDLPQIFDTDFQYFKPGSKRKFKRYFEKYGFTVKFAPRIYGNPYAQPPYYTEVIRGSDTLIYRESPSLSSEKTDYELFAAKFKNKFPPLKALNPGKHIYSVFQTYELPYTEGWKGPYFFIHPSIGIKNIQQICRLIERPAGKITFIIEEMTLIPKKNIAKRPFCNVVITTLRKTIADYLYTESVFYLNSEYLNEYAPTTISKILEQDSAQNNSLAMGNNRDSIKLEAKLYERYSTMPFYGTRLYPNKKDTLSDIQSKTLLELCNEDTLAIITTNSKMFIATLQCFPIKTGYKRMQKEFQKHQYRVIFGNRMYGNEHDDDPPATYVVRQGDTLIYTQPINSDPDTLKALAEMCFALSVAHFTNYFPPLGILNIGGHIDRVFKEYGIPFVPFSGQQYIFIWPNQLHSTWYLPDNVIQYCKDSPIGCNSIIVKTDERGYISSIRYLPFMCLRETYPCSEGYAWSFDYDIPEKYSGVPFYI